MKRSRSFCDAARHWGGVGLLVLGACSRRGRELGPDPVGSKSVAPSPAPTPSPAPKSPPLRVEVRKSGKSVELVVVNAGEVGVSLAEDVDLQREEAGAYVSTHYEVWIEPGCQRGKLSTCVALAPGAALRPIAWEGMSCSAACPCHANVMAAPGTYRFVLRRCDDGTFVESPSFTWP